MSQLYEKKCDCKYYDDLNDHSATLLKMELPEYETAYSGSGYMICRALRFIGYTTVMVLLGYSLWRIHVIESTLLASDRLHNLTRSIALESNRLHHNRVSRSVPVGHLADVNSVGVDKELPRGAMLTAKNEFVPTKRRRPADEREFDYLVQSLFTTIQTMHNDTDRSHLGSNMKALFQAWFPVFDALLPEELVEDQLEPLAGTIRSVNDRMARSVNEKDENTKSEWNKVQRIIRSTADKTSEESSEEKKQINTGVAGDRTSKESSEEKKERNTGLAGDKTSKESSEEKKQRITGSVVDKTSEESSEEKKQRFARSVSVSSEESKSSSEEAKRRVKYNKNNKSKESSEEKEKKDKSKKKKSSEESVESSESAESKEKKMDNKKNELFYQVVSSDQNGSKTIVQVD